MSLLPISLALLLTTMPCDEAPLHLITVTDAHGKQYTFPLFSRDLGSPDAAVKAFCLRHEFDPVYECIDPLKREIEIQREMFRGRAVQFTAHARHIEGQKVTGSLEAETVTQLRELVNTEVASGGGRRRRPTADVKLTDAGGVPAMSGEELAELKRRIPPEVACLLARISVFRSNIDGEH